MSKRTLGRLVNKDIKKWCRLIYQGHHPKIAFYKCKLVSTCLNQKYKMQQLTKKDFEDFLNKLEDIRKDLPYTLYENDFMLKFENFYNNKVKK